MTSGTVDHATLFDAASRALNAGGVDTGDAETALRRLAVFSPGFVGGYLAWGDRARRNRAVARARGLLGRAAVLAPADVRVQITRSAAESQARAFSKAGASSRRALILAPGRADALRSVVVAESGAARPDHAARWCVRREVIVPASPQERMLHARALFDLDRLADCDEELRRVSVTDPGRFQAIAMAAQVHALRRAPIAAERLVARLAVLDPWDPELVLAKGRLAAVSGDLAAAVESFKRGSLLRPDDPAAAFERARADWAREDFAAAERAMHHATAIDPARAVKCAVLRLTVTPRDFMLPSRRG